MATRAKSKAPFFPLMLDLNGRKCLVVGAGRVAAGKINGLLSHGAKVAIVSPRAIPEIQVKARARGITWLRRAFAAEDVNGAFLVIAATNSSEVNGSVFRACRERRVLCNAVDDPEHCDFFYPAVVRRGPLQIAISTNGNLPALAARLRKELDAQFGPEWTEWVKHVGKLRRQIRREQLSPAKRRKVLSELAARKPAAQSARRRRKAK